jgi:hypothetical protein
MTVNVHDDEGFGSGGRYDDSEEVARTGASTCDDGVGVDHDDEPYVVFGYGSLIFRVRSFARRFAEANIISSLLSTTRRTSPPFFAASTTRHQNEYASLDISFFLFGHRGHRRDVACQCGGTGPGGDPGLLVYL